MKIPTDNFERLADRLEQWATEYEALAAKADAVKVHPHSATRWRGRAQGYRSAAQLIRDEIRRENERILSAECGWCGQTAEMDATGRILTLALMVHATGWD